MIMALKSVIYAPNQVGPATSEEAFTACYETNVLGSRRVTNVFKKLLSASANPRLVFLSTSLSSVHVEVRSAKY